MLSALNLKQLYFSYSQFFVHDDSIALPGCAWTETHSRQGFARRQSSVCFGTLIEFGHAQVTVRFGSFTVDHSYARAIAVPIYLPSGKCLVDGPEEFGAERSFKAQAGHFRLTAAQRLLSPTELEIDLFLEKVDVPIARSKILVADDLLKPLTPLLETTEVA